MYGYRIIGGKAVIDADEAQKIQELFNAYLSGMSLYGAAEKAGIHKTHSSIRLMLKNKRYTGEGFYPKIISEELFEKVDVERQKRMCKMGRMKTAEMQEPSPITQVYSLRKVKKKYEDPFEQAEYAYSMITSGDEPEADEPQEKPKMTITLI